MRKPRTPQLEISARMQYAAFLTQNKRAYKLLKAFGINPRRAKIIALRSETPTLREALVIDCVTNGAPNVYAWVDTEYMEQRSNELVEEEVNSMWRMWPVNTDAAYREQLRLHMVQRLGKPDRNSLAIIAKLGRAEISKQARRDAVLRILPHAVFLNEDATDEQAKRAIERLERRRARAVAYVKGKRSSVDT
jgi:hypothetical protein